VWGVGAWGEKHARVYHAIEDAELVGVHDHHPGRAAEVAERHGCRAFETADELLRACEAVSIAVPTVAHREAVLAGARVGCAMLVEKPMAATVSEADAMIEAARSAGVRLEVGQVERFNPALLAVRPHLRGPKFIECHRMAMFQPRSLDIDVVFDLMIHDLDAVIDIVGAAPATISAVGVAVLSENEDIANARLEFPDGCVANLTASRVSQERLRRIRFFTDDRYVSVDLFAKSGEMLEVDVPRLRAARAHPLAALGAITRVKIEPQTGEPLELELRAFLRSVRGEGPGAASAEAGRSALAVAEEIRAAMKRRARQWTTLSNAAS
jgi:predicted dehydrogenase